MAHFIFRSDVSLRSRGCEATTCSRSSFKRSFRHKPKPNLVFPLQARQVRITDCFISFSKILYIFSMALSITYLVKKRAGRREAKLQNTVRRVPGSGQRDIRPTFSELLDEEVEEPRKQRMARKDCQNCSSVAPS